MIKKHYCKKCFGMFFIDVNIKDTLKACPYCYPQNVKESDNIQGFSSQLESINITLDIIMQLNMLEKNLRR